MEFDALEEGLKTKTVDGEVEDEDDSPFEADEEQLMTDINEALILIKRSKTLIDYISDPELCKTMSKRERLSMLKLSGKLAEYVSSIEGTYGEGASYDVSL